MTAPKSGRATWSAFWVVPVALLPVSFWITSTLTNRERARPVPIEKDRALAAPPPVGERRPQQQPRVSVERLARALVAIKEASMHDACAPAASPLPIPDELGPLQKLTVDGPHAERAAATDLRRQIRLALELSLLPCWRDAPTLKLTANIRATVRRMGQDFEVVDATIQDLSADPFGPAESECVQQRIAERRVVNSQAAVRRLPEGFESAESFHLRLRKRPPPTKAAPEQPATPAP